MGQLIIDNIPVFWLLFGVMLTTFEAILFPGVGFLFAGLAAITVGGLIAFGYLSEIQYLKQLTLFIAFTAVWTAVLWIPLKKRKSNKLQKIGNMVGQNAIVINSPIQKGKLGKVRWSGTVMNARLDNTSAESSVDLETEVVITKVEGNTVYILPLINKE